MCNNWSIISLLDFLYLKEYPNVAHKIFIVNKKNLKYNIVFNFFIIERKVMKLNSWFCKNKDLKQEKGNKIVEGEINITKRQKFNQEEI